MRSGNKLCVGCQTHYDPEIGRGVMFSPLKKKEADRRCGAWGKGKGKWNGKGHGKVYRPPCGRGGDFCSVSLPCSKDYACIENFDSSLFKCSWESTRCRCALPALLPEGNGVNKNMKSNKKASPKTNDSPVAQNNIMFYRCLSDADCPGANREVCVPYTTKGNHHVCVSCDYALAAYDVGPLSAEQRAKCSKITRRAQPGNYVLGPNGRAMDRCRTFEHCMPGHSCVRERSDYSNTYGDGAYGGYGSLRPLQPCAAAASPLCFCKPPVHEKCKSWRDCKPGEACVNEPRFNLTANCASTAFLHVLSSDKYELLGGSWTTDVQRLGPPPAPSAGRKEGGEGGLTGDKCKYDWDCKGKLRRCTHITDLYGRCAGRKQCYCQPLFKRACSSVSDCTKSDKGETCATTVGTNSRPFCMSSAAVSKNPFFFPVNDPSLSALNLALLPSPFDPKTALTGQLCLTTNDCKQPRTCVHRFDTAGACDGNRAGCVCKNIGRFARRKAVCSKERPYCEEQGEVCTMIVGEVPRNRVCVAKTAVKEMRKAEVEERVVFE